MSLVAFPPPSPSVATPSSSECLDELFRTNSPTAGLVAMGAARTVLQRRACASAARIPAAAAYAAQKTCIPSMSHAANPAHWFCRWGCADAAQGIPDRALSPLRKPLDAGADLMPLPSRARAEYNGCGTSSREPHLTAPPIWPASVSRWLRWSWSRKGIFA
jgi:hypothetical protein